MGEVNVYSLVCVEFFLITCEKEDCILKIQKLIIEKYKSRFTVDMSSFAGLDY